MRFSYSPISKRLVDSLDKVSVQGQDRIFIIQYLITVNSKNRIDLEMHVQPSSHCRGSATPVKSDD
jgi:hypothetical protein